MSWILLWADPEAYKYQTLQSCFVMMIGNYWLFITQWLNFFTMDTISDLAFGESFACLERGEYHEWVRTLFRFLKYMSLGAAPRYYPTLEFFLMKLMPKSVMKGQKKHMQYAYEKINRRIDLKSERPDFMTPFMRTTSISKASLAKKSWQHSTSS